MPRLNTYDQATIIVKCRGTKDSWLRVNNVTVSVEGVLSIKFDNPGQTIPFRSGGFARAKVRIPGPAGSRLTVTIPRGAVSFLPEGLVMTGALAGEWEYFAEMTAVYN